MKSRILVAGIGNVFFSDDGFGVEVVRRLRSQTLPEGVTVNDFGIRGLHLAFEIVSGYDLVIVIDAVARGGPPGTLYVLEPDAELSGHSPDAHSMELRNVLAFVEQLSERVPRMLIVGCEPASTDPGMALSEVAASSIDRAVGLVRDLCMETPV